MNIRALSAIVALLALGALSATRCAAQSASPVHVVTYVDIMPENVSKARALLRLYREAAANEVGNGSAEVLQEIARPGRIVICETWSSQSAFETHSRSPAATLLASGLRQYELAPADQRVHAAFVAGAGPAAAGGSAVHVLTHVDVLPTRQAEIEPLLKALQTASVKSGTAVRFEVLQQAGRKNHFTVLETWTNRRALDAQAQSEAQREFRTKLGPMLGALYDQRLYSTMR